MATPETPACDVTLIDEMLARTPEERLRENDRMVRTIQELLGPVEDGQPVRDVGLDSLVDLQRTTTDAGTRFALELIGLSIRRYR